MSDIPAEEPPRDLSKAFEGYWLIPGPTFHVTRDGECLCSHELPEHKKRAMKEQKNLDGYYKMTTVGEINTLPVTEIPEICSACAYQYTQKVSVA